MMNGGTIRLNRRGARADGCLPFGVSSSAWRMLPAPDRHQHHSVRIAHGEDCPVIVMGISSSKGQAWHVLHLGRDPFRLGFLHQWYYDTLANVDRRQEPPPLPANDIGRRADITP